MADGDRTSARPRAVFILELELGADQPPVGTIRQQGLEQHESVPFHGWIALMQAIDRLRSQTKPT
ncbi:MAG TPA: hypothetical protein VGJ60_03130 [Chloroflexota bacterium]|jgi:hypothetical protein